jgi:heme-degrading monooxygenase HmoA
MVVVLIRTQLRADVDRALYEETGARMDTLVRAMPGFVSARDYVAEDGDQVSMVCFESHEALRAWRELPAHVEAQQLGKTKIYASYSIQVCEVTRSYAFP